MSALKLVREFKRKAKLAGYQVIEVSTSGGGHLHAIVDHGAVQQRITLPSSPASLEHSIKAALDEIRRFRTAHEATTQHDLYLHGPGGQQDAHAQASRQQANCQADGRTDRRAARRHESPTGR